MPKAYLELEDITKLEAAATCVRDQLLIRLLFWSGCRISEALGIRVEDIDFDQGIVTIKHLKTRIRLTCPDCGTRLSRQAKFCPGCGKQVPAPVRRQQESHRVRQVPIDKQTLDMMKGFIERGNAVNRNGQRLVFGIGRTQAWKVVHDCAQKAGITGLVNPETGRMRGVSPHRLRDSFATMAIQVDDSTDSVRLLQEQLGHANIGTTLRYRKIAGAEHREWYEKLLSRKSQPLSAKADSLSLPHQG